VINILIVDDEGLFGQMLRICLSSFPNLEVAAVASSGNDAIEEADRLLPDVVLMDIELGSEPNGIAAGRTIKNHHSQIGMILLSAHNERKYVDLLSEEEYSSWSYLVKQSLSDIGALVRAIEGAASGFVVMDPGVYRAMPRNDSVTANLTPRQIDVLVMMANGYNNAYIAECLGLGSKSVENYINAIYRELQVTSNDSLHPRVQAVLNYIRDSTD